MLLIFYVKDKTDNNVLKVLDGASFKDEISVEMSVRLDDIEYQKVPMANGKREVEAFYHVTATRADIKKSVSKSDKSSSDSSSPSYDYTPGVVDFADEYDVGEGCPEDKIVDTLQNDNYYVHVTSHEVKYDDQGQVGADNVQYTYVYKNPDGYYTLTDYRENTFTYVAGVWGYGINRQVGEPDYDFSGLNDTYWIISTNNYLENISSLFKDDPIPVSKNTTKTAEYMKLPFHIKDVGDIEFEDDTNSISDSRSIDGESWFLKQNDRNIGTVKYKVKGKTYESSVDMYGLSYYDDTQKITIELLAYKDNSSEPDIMYFAISPSSNYSGDRDDESQLIPISKKEFNNYSSDDVTSKKASSSSSNNDTGGGKDYVLPYSDTEVLDNDTVASLSDEKLRYAINEMYARHGYHFSTSKMQNYFSNLDWYVDEGITDQNQIKNEMNSIEKKNLKKLTKERDSRL